VREGLQGAGEALVVELSSSCQAGLLAQSTMILLEREYVASESCGVGTWFLPQLTASCKTCCT
jgi:hypothetical protein